MVGSQFPAVFQSVFVAPLQVLAAANTGVEVKNNSKPPSNTAAIGPAPNNLFFFVNHLIRV